MQLEKYPRILYVKPSNKLYIFTCIYIVDFYIFEIKALKPFSESGVIGNVK